MHKLLQSQLRAIGLERSDTVPNKQQWQNLLSTVSDEYTNYSKDKQSDNSTVKASKVTSKKGAKPNKQTIQQYQAQVLIVEDNEVNKQVAKNMLEVFGCDVTEVDDGAQALQILEISNFDIVFMDCQMPVMDGMEATKLLRNKELDSNQHVTVIALTANVIKNTKK